MKKSLICLLLSALALMNLTSCTKDSEGLTKITTYAVITLDGGPIYKVKKGSTYTDPGYTAMQGSEDVTGNVTVSGSVNTNECGFYTITYRVVNPDGFPATAQRTVVVVDPNSLASAYLSSVKYGSRAYSNLHILIKQGADQKYYIDDLAGGLYCQGRYPGYEAYGYDFWYDAAVKVEGDAFMLDGDMGDGMNWYWEEPLDVANGKYDRATGTITYGAAFGGDPDDAISVTLTK